MGIRTIIITEADCKSDIDGYHLNVWENICVEFGIDPDLTDHVELSLYAHRDNLPEHEE